MNFRKRRILQQASFNKEGLSGGSPTTTKKKTEKKTALFSEDDSEDDSEDELCCDDGKCHVFENEGQGQAAQQTQDGMREFNRMQLAAVRFEDIVRS